MFLNLDELRGNDFWDNYFKSSIIENNSNSYWLQKFEKETGIGLNKGISQAIISSGADYKNAAVIILNSNFEKVKSNFENQNYFTRYNIDKKTIYQSKGKHPLQFYFVNDSTLLVANDLNYIKMIISRKNNSLKMNKRFIAAINSIKNKKQYWIASDEGEHIVNYIRKIFNFEKKIPVNNVLKSIKSITLSAKFDDVLELESGINCSDPKNAYLLSTAIKGVLAMDLLSGGDYSFGKILQKTEVERLNSQINLQLELKGSEIKTINNFAKQNNLVRKL